MPKIHSEILTKEQTELLPLIKSFFEDFGLVGGTAIALLMGHRRSVDFDLFTDKEFENIKVRKEILKFNKIDKVIMDEGGQYTIIINKVRFTFFSFPFKIDFSERFDNIIKLPDLLTLAAMKAYALGRRAKWKDYVDLYFIMKDCDINKVIRKAEIIFGDEFNEKMFRTQLAYFKDIDYTEKIDYMERFEIDDGIIKRKLTEFSLN